MLCHPCPSLKTTPSKTMSSDRQPFGEALLNIVTRSKEELVVSIDGQWGEGKTTFVKTWRGLLAEHKIPSIYIDAFANDYSDDAFIAIASDITDFIEQNVVFVLVMNKVQLEQSVKIVYGQELDTHTYLQKFINLETRIPKRLSDPYMSDASKYIQKLISLHEFEDQRRYPCNYQDH